MKPKKNTSASKQHPSDRKPAASKEPDWKAIANRLAKEVMFALNHLKCAGSGMTFSLDENGGYKEGKHWKENFADALETIPGVKVDREAMHALDLPKKQRLKFFKEREEARKAEAQDATA